jgi:hypothetical protein
VSRAARAAYEGDGRAAFFISEALLSCALVTNIVHTNSDGEAEYKRRYVDLPNAPQWARDVNQQRFDQCVHLAKSDPFGELPKREGGYGSPQYWRDQALADGDALARIERAGQELAGATDPRRSAEKQNQEAITRAREDVLAALNSADPWALFRVGWLLSGSSQTNDRASGVAIALAACDLGYDCTAANPANPFSRCKDSAGCPADSDFAYLMQQSMGSDQYARAYARAQEFEDLLARKDQTAIGKFVTLGPSP